MKKVLVTGGAGFIGSHLAAYWAEAGAQVTVLDNLRTGSLDNLTGVRATFVDGSVTDSPLVRRLTDGVDYIFHLAAMVSVSESLADPALCVDINVKGTLNVLEGARSGGASKVVFSSSAAVYGDDPRTPKDESMCPAPITPYGITKLDAELYLQMYTQQYGVPTASLRSFNVYGPRQAPGSQYATVVPIFIDNALRGRDLVIFGDGQQTRDFVYVQDVVGANVLAATSSLQGVHNVGLGGSTTVEKLAATIIQLTGSKSQIRYANARMGDIKHSTADIRRLSQAGYVPSTDLSSGLKVTIEHFRRVLAGAM